MEKPAQRRPLGWAGQECAPISQNDNMTLPFKGGARTWTRPCRVYPHGPWSGRIRPTEKYTSGKAKSQSSIASQSLGH